MFEKKGETSIMALVIAVVLGLALMIFLIWGLYTNWSIFRTTTSAYTGGGANADTIKQVCDISCDWGRLNEFCGLKQEVDLGDGKKITGTCHDLAVNVPDLGFVACPGDKIPTTQCIELSKSVVYNDERSPVAVTGSCVKGTKECSGLTTPADCLAANLVCNYTAATTSNLAGSIPMNCQPNGVECASLSNNEQSCKNNAKQVCEWKTTV